MFDVYQFYESMEKNDIMLLFKGNISPDLVTSILQISENRLETLDEAPKVKKKVFNILVECLQNVYHHMDKNKAEQALLEENANSAILMMGKAEDGYFIVTGNHILTEKAIKLGEKLEELNLLSREELKQAYQDVLANEGFSEKGGAGLGFIDILRKSGEKLEFAFRDIDDKFSFFSLKVKISNKQKVKT